jgi:hypothetical protein
MKKNNFQEEDVIAESEYREQMSILEATQHCRIQLNKLVHNLDHLNKIYDGIIDSIKTNVNK